MGTQEEKVKTAPQTPVTIKEEKPNQLPTPVPKKKTAVDPYFFSSSTTLSIFKDDLKKESGFNANGGSSFILSSSKIYLEDVEDLVKKTIGKLEVDMSPTSDKLKEAASLKNCKKLRKIEEIRQASSKLKEKYKLKSLYIPL